MEEHRFKISGAWVTVPGVLVWECSRCDERITEAGEMSRAKGIAKILAPRRRHTA